VLQPLLRVIRFRRQRAYNQALCDVDQVVLLLAVSGECINSCCQEAACE
jgi:hypothetical protein